MSENDHAVVIGGGITGLSAAFYLQKEAEKKNLPLMISLVEAGEKLGGKIQTISHNGFLIEKGPDSFLKRKTSAVDLIKEVGLEKELVTNETGQAYILKGSELYPIPEGAMMGIPTKMKPFVHSRLLSVKGKARAACDLVIPRAEVNGDQSVGSFFRRRLGNELVDSFIEPLLSGIYASDIDELSLTATFPHFQQLEKKHRSLILAMQHSRPSKQAGKDKGQFFTLKRGLFSLVEALEEQLLKTQQILVNTAAASIQKEGKQYNVHLENGKKLRADAVVMASPHHVSGNLLNQYDFMRNIKKMKAATVANVALGFSESDVTLDQDGTGFIVASKGEYNITACTWTHKKWPHTTPEGKVLMRCFVGRPGEEEIVQQSDKKIVEAVLKDLKKVIPIRKSPAFYYVTRWNEAMPQYSVGHQNMVADVKEKLKEEMPGVVLAGSSYNGIGIGDCSAQGKQAAEYVLEHLKQKKLFH
ncbi:protoporphyrinogen oxidase [Bacillus taeanensis]|uniref:Coproporphyrinogen III oxidase n=1 Tax=Bacillus taeanensis TaxID=273032 RepID=A0A366XV71_9BACI|nr:protoporphyrinogen oxidase [Bacillus taeanensis]RBW68669.1 protoporphyrinogen oxidase [Bacillus taeanensis]